MLPVFIVFYPYLWQIHLKWIESNDSNPIFGVWTRTQWCCCHWEILRQLEMPTWSKISIQVLNDDGSTLPSIGSPVDLAEKNAESTESKIIRCTKNVHMLVPTRRIFPHFSHMFPRLAMLLQCRIMSHLWCRDQWWSTGCFPGEGHWVTASQPGFGHRGPIGFTETCRSGDLEAGSARGLFGSPGCKSHSHI